MQRYYLCHLTERRTTMATKKTPAKKTDEDRIVTSVKALTAPDVVGKIGNLQIDIQSTLANIATCITGQLEQLKNTDTAIAAQETRLQELYEIEKEAQSIEQILLSQKDEQERYSKLIAARNEEYAENDADRNKKWKREDEEHAYAVALRNKKALDDHQALVDSNRRNEAIRQATLQTDWTNREAELKARETEFNDFKKKVEGFEAVLKSEVSKAETILGNTIKKQYEHQIALLQKDMESERNMSDAKIHSYQVQVGQMHEQIVELNKQLAAARNDAKEVTSQALQSASGRQVVDALQKQASDSKSSK